MDRAGFSRAQRPGDLGLPTVIQRLISRGLVLAWLLGATPWVQAAESVWVSSGMAKARIITPASGIVSGEALDVGVELELPEGWHTYWRNPGDSGVPVSLTWSGQGLKSSSKIRWPIPDRIPYGPLVNLGYKESVLLTQRLAFENLVGVDAIELTVSGRWLVCEAVCIPETKVMTLTLPVVEQAAVNPELKVRFDQLPLPQRAAGISETRWLSQTDLEIRLNFPGIDLSRLDGLYFLPFEEGVLDLTVAPTAVVEADQIVLGVGFEDASRARYDGLLWFQEWVNGERVTAAFMIEVPSPNDNSGGLAFLQAILMALLGGMILNLMPCVFPVLSIKVLGLMAEAGGSQQAQRQQGWWYTCGVIASFVLIALVLMVLRAVGEQIGWGFQLQSPVVVALLAILFLLMGLNLSGFYTIGSGISVNVGPEKGRLGALSSGVLAVVIAAPCTAPFMGAALGYALVQPPLIGLTVFASLGLGMALPMLLLSYSPGLLAVLPRPGAWMNRFKEGAAFLMYATMIWLLWILIQQAGEFGFVLTALSALLVVFAVWLWQAFNPTGLQRVLLLASVLGAGWAISQIAVLAPTMPRPEQARAGDGGIQSEPYTEALLRAAKAEGPVFVNFTADWCITCKVNEVVAIDTEGTTELFEALGVRYLKADWTLEDPKITAALARFGRVGVPLYLVYHRGSETPLILPQILTGEMIRQALQTKAPAEINDA